MSMLRSKIFIIFFSILTSCRTLDFQQYTDEDYDRKMQKFAHAIKTKANIPVGGCTLVDIVSPKYGKITNKFCKRGKNRWINDADKSDNNLYAFNENGVLYVVGSKPENKRK